LESDLGARVSVKDLTVSLLDAKAKPLISWSIVRAWPVKWQIAAFDAQTNALAVETMEFSFQRIERKVGKTLDAMGFF